jgi:hypothetical protein
MQCDAVHPHSIWIRIQLLASGQCIAHRQQTPVLCRIRYVTSLAGGDALNVLSADVYGLISQTTLWPYVPPNVAVP